MKISDKERLDWADEYLSRQFYRPGFGTIIVDFEGTEYDGDSLRTAIDAAIRAGKRNKI